MIVIVHFMETVNNGFQCWKTLAVCTCSPAHGIRQIFAGESIRPGLSIIFLFND